MRENPIELFKENADIESNHLQPALKCRGFVNDNSFPMILEENKFMLTIENTSITKMKNLVTSFALLLCNHCVQLIVLKKFSVINGIFSKMYHQVAK